MALGQFSGSFVLSAAFLLLGVVCVPLALLLGDGGRQMSLSLRAGRAALAEDVGSDAASRCSSDHGAVLCGVSCALWCELCSVV